jgi:hypothetical protein
VAAGRCRLTTAAVEMVALALMHLQIVFPVRLMLLVEMAVLEPLI